MLVAAFYNSMSSRGLALRLRRSAETFGVRCRVFDRSGRAGIDGERGWRPEALMRTLADFPDDDVLLLEPGSVLLARPDFVLDEPDFDSAVHVDAATGLPTGPLFLRNNDRLWEMLRSWYYLCRDHPECGEYGTLLMALEDVRLGLDVRDLPVTYSWVEGIHRDENPDATPVIARFLADGRTTTRFVVVS